MGGIRLSLHHDRTRRILDQFLGSPSFWRVVPDVSVFEPLLEDAPSGIGAPPGEKRTFSNFAAFLVRGRVDRIDGYGLFD